MGNKYGFREVEQTEKECSSILCQPDYEQTASPIFITALRYTYVPEAVFADPVYDAHIKAWRRHLKTVKAKASKPHAKKIHKGQNKPKARKSVSATNLFNQASSNSQQPVVKPKKRKNPGALRKQRVPL